MRFAVSMDELWCLRWPRDSRFARFLYLPGGEVGPTHKAHLLLGLMIWMAGDGDFGSDIVKVGMPLVSATGVGLSATAASSALGCFSARTMQVARRELGTTILFGVPRAVHCGAPRIAQKPMKDLGNPHRIALVRQARGAGHDLRIESSMAVNS